MDYRTNRGPPFFLCFQKRRALKATSFLGTKFTGAKSYRPVYHLVAGGGAAVASQLSGRICSLENPEAKRFMVFKKSRLCQRPRKTGRGRGLGPLGCFIYFVSDGDWEGD